jgi:hypothetical protein
VVVGVDRYGAAAPGLRSSVNDAKTVDAALGAAGVPAADRVLLRDADASAANIRAALARLSARATPATTAVFFFAGHARSLGAGHEAVLASDGQMITDQELANLLAPVTGRMWVGMATCYGGGFTELVAPDRVLTAAADAKSEAYENDKLGVSYLVEGLVRHGLGGNFSRRSIQAAFEAGTAYLERHHPDRLPVIVSESDRPLVVVQP